MPFKSVIIKGFGKVKFPASMSDDAIEKAIEGNRQLFSGTYGDPISSTDQIVPFGGYLPSGADNYFGGVFASETQDIAESHGSSIQRFLVPDDKAMTHDDFRDLLFSEKGEGVVDDAVRNTLYEDLTPDELEEMVDYVAESKNPFDDTPDMGEERFFEILGADDYGQASWKLQGLKGEVARRQGFEAIEMPDEHGTSWLVLGGKNTKMPASLAVGTLGAGAMLKGEEAQAATGTMTGPKHPKIADLKAFIDKHDDILMDDMLGGVTSYLDKLSYEDKITMKDRLLLALDLI